MRAVRLAKSKKYHYFSRGPAAICNAPDPMFQPEAIASAMKVTAPAGPETIVRYMSAQPLQSAPGTRYAYSNFGYCVLGRVIEAVSGQSYADFVRQHVWAPLGLEADQIAFGRTKLGQEAKNEVAYCALPLRRSPQPHLLPIDSPASSRLSAPVGPDPSAERRAVAQMPATRRSPASSPRTRACPDPTAHSTSRRWTATARSSPPPRPLRALPPR